MVDIVELLYLWCLATNVTEDTPWLGQHHRTHQPLAHT